MFLRLFLSHVKVITVEISLPPQGADESAPQHVLTVDLTAANSSSVPAA